MGVGVGGEEKNMSVKMKLPSSEKYKGEVTMEENRFRGGKKRGR